MDSESASILHRLPHSALRICGPIPDSWEIRELDTIIDPDSPICYGILMPGDDQPDGVLVVRVKDMIGGGIAQSGLHRTSKAIDDQYSRSRLKAHDILLAIRGATAGLIAVVSGDLEGANITQDTARIRLGSACDRGFLFQSLQGDFLQHQVKLNIVGQAVQGINIAEVRRLAVPLPPRLEQEEIAKILEAWDRAINLTEKLIAAKQKIKSALVHRLLAGKSRLPGFSKEWQTVKAGDIFKPVSAKNHPGERVLSVTQDMGVVGRDEMDRKINMNLDNTGGYKLVLPGDFIISLRSFQGGLEMSRLRGIVSPAYHVIRPTTEIDREFFRHYFKSYEFIGRLAVAVIGIRDGKQVSFEDFSFLKFHVPHLDEQKAISAVLNTQDREIGLLQQKLGALRRQKKGLMQQLLTGKVRVKVTQSSGE